MRWLLDTNVLLRLADAQTHKVLSTPLQRRRNHEETTQKGGAADGAGADEIPPEYDFSRATRNHYASRYAAGSAVVVLEPDVAAAFPTSGEANEALRALAGIIQKHRSRRPASRRTC